MNKEVKKYIRECKSSYSLSGIRFMNLLTMLRIFLVLIKTLHMSLCVKSLEIPTTSLCLL